MGDNVRASRTLEIGVQNDSFRDGTLQPDLGRVEFDGAGCLVACNQPLCDLLGTPMSALRGLHMTELVHPKDHSVTVDAVGFFAEIGTTGDWTEARVRSSRGWLPIEFRVERAGRPPAAGLSVIVRLSRRTVTSQPELERGLDEILEHLYRLGRDPAGEVLTDVLVRLSAMTNRPDCSIRLIRDDRVVVEHQNVDRLPIHRVVPLGQVINLVSMLDVVGWAGLDPAQLRPAWDNERAFLSSEDCKIVYAAPVRRRGELVGWLDVASHLNDRRLTPAMRDAVGAVADQLSLSIAQWAPEEGDDQLGVVRATVSSGTQSQAVVVEEINQRLAGADDDPVVVIRIALDGFGALSTRTQPDMTGELHDKVLAAISSCLPEDGFACRLASGGFVAVVSGRGQAAEAPAVAADIQHEIQESFEHTYGFTASIGLTVNQLGLSARGMMREANLALISAKRQGRNQLAIST